MKRNWIIIIAVSFLFASCGDNSSETTYSDKDTSTTTVTAVEPTVTSPTYNPPDNVRTVFQTKYPTATNVTWSAYKPYDRINWEWTGWPSMDTSYYAVNYTVDNRPHWGWFDRNSNWKNQSLLIIPDIELYQLMKRMIRTEWHMRSSLRKAMPGQEY